MTKDSTEGVTRSDFPLRVLVCGGRDYDDAQRVCDVLNDLEIAALAHGDQRGADRLAAAYGAACVGRFPTHPYPADWRKHGKAAGPIRNRQMLDDFQPDLVVAFPGGSGTAHMVKIARAAGVEVLLVDAPVGVAGEDKE